METSNHSPRLPYRPASGDASPAGNASLSTSPSLLAKADRGDPEAWSQVVQIYGPLVYSWARKGGLSAEDAADVLQDTMLALSDGLKRFDPQAKGASFRGWLRQIARNKCVDVIRRSVKQPAVARGGSTNMKMLSEDAIAEGLSLDSSNHDRDEQRQVVERALAIMRCHFEKSTWRAFWRTVVDGCSPEDVAQELGLSRWNVYKARSRVLQRLRSELQGLEQLE